MDTREYLINYLKQGKEIRTPAKNSDFIVQFTEKLKYQSPFLKVDGTPKQAIVCGLNIPEVGISTSSGESTCWFPTFDVVAEPLQLQCYMRFDQANDIQKILGKQYKSGLLAISPVRYDVEIYAISDRDQEDTILDTLSGYATSASLAAPLPSILSPVDWITSFRNFDPGILLTPVLTMSDCKLDPPVVSIDSQNKEFVTMTTRITYNKFTQY